MAEVAAVSSTAASVALSPSRKRSASPLEDTATSTALITTDQSGEVSEPPAKKTKLIRRKRRPARPQVDPSTAQASQPPPQTGTVFNIWYNKWSGGDREDALLSQTHAQGRCNVKQDSGWTTADKVRGAYFCLFFARGLCPKGHECQYLHRLPTIYDVYNPNIDCFGRDRHSDYRDDMGGVGSFLRQNRTLYVGRIHVTDDIEEVVARHFQEWGEIDRIRVLTGRGVAFVTYVNEANSQFAKEAMAHQSLDHEEVLNVRWATVDPNPLSQKREAARIEEQAAEAVRRALGERAVKQIEGRESREEIEARKIEASYGLDGYEAPEAIWFNRQKQVEDTERMAPLEGTGQKKMILGAAETEAGTAYSSSSAAAAAAAVTATPMKNGSSSEESNAAIQGSRNGLLGGSTLAALQGFAANNSNATAQAARPTSSGPLVAYGSDEDDDDDDDDDNDG